MAVIALAIDLDRPAIVNANASQAARRRAHGFHCNGVYVRRRGASPVSDARRYFQCGRRGGCRVARRRTTIASVR